MLTITLSNQGRIRLGLLIIRLVGASQQEDFWSRPSLANVLLQQSHATLLLTVHRTTIETQGTRTTTKVWLLHFLVESLGSDQYLRSCAKGTARALLARCCRISKVDIILFIIERYLGISNIVLITKQDELGLFCYCVFMLSSLDFL